MVEKKTPLVKYIPFTPISQFAWWLVTFQKIMMQIETAQSEL